MEHSPTFRKNKIPFTSVCREDIAALGNEGKESITDSAIDNMVQKIMDDYAANFYWEDLCLFAKEHCGLEKEKHSKVN